MNGELDFEQSLRARVRLLAGLPQSVLHFPEGDVLAARMRVAGFTNVRWRPLTFGIAALHVGEIP